MNFPADEFSVRTGLDLVVYEDEVTFFVLSDRIQRCKSEVNRKAEQ